MNCADQVAPTVGGLRRRGRGGRAGGPAPSTGEAMRAERGHGPVARRRIHRRKSASFRAAAISTSRHGAAAPAAGRLPDLRSSWVASPRGIEARRAAHDDRRASCAGLRQARDTQPSERLLPRGTRQARVPERVRRCSQCRTPARGGRPRPRSGARRGGAPAEHLGQPVMFPVHAGGSPKDADEAL